MKLTKGGNLPQNQSRCIPATFDGATKLHFVTFVLEQTFSTIHSCCWNELSDEIKKAPSVAFKFRLDRNLHKPPKYFNRGTRQGQILHPRLRLECSSLNAHLYKNQRTNGPVNAHLMSWPSKAQNIKKNRKIYGKEMTLTFNTQIPSLTQLVVCIYQLSGHWLQ